MDDLDALLLLKDNKVFNVYKFKGYLDSEAISVKDLNVNNDLNLKINFKD